MADSPNASPAPARALEGQKLLLCVGGGIAAYKALELVRRLRDAGAQVQVAMTAGAQQFVTPLSFQALSGQPTRTTLWDSAAEQAMGHIELARWADRIVVAPGTADLLARLAQGHADDLVSTLCLASTAPLTICPAMNHRMWLHPATQANIALLRQRGAQVVGPVDGLLAEGESGPGRLAEQIRSRTRCSPCPTNNAPSSRPAWSNSSPGCSSMASTSRRNWRRPFTPACRRWPARPCASLRPRSGRSR